MLSHPDWPAKPLRLRGMYALEAEWDRQVKQIDDLLARSPDNATYLFLKGYLEWSEERRDDAAKLLARARPLAADPWAIDRFLKADAVAEK